MPEEPKMRIGFVATSLLLVVALTLDALQFLLLFIPGLDVVFDFFIGVIAIIVFGVWFAILGVNYFSGDRTGAKLLSMVGSSVVELVPLLDALPGITLGVWGIIYAVQKEDAAKKIAYEESVKKNLRQQRGQRWARPEEYSGVDTTLDSDDSLYGDEEENEEEFENS